MSYRLSLCRPCCNERGIFAVSVQYGGSVSGRIFAHDDVSAELEWTYDLTSLSTEYDSTVRQPRHLAFDQVDGSLYCELIETTGATIELLKLDRNGQFQWLKTVDNFNSAVLNTGAFTLSLSSAIGERYGQLRVSNQNVYVAHHVLSSGVFLTKFDSDGNVLKTYSPSSLTLTVPATVVYTSQPVPDMSGYQFEPPSTYGSGDIPLVLGFDVDFDGNIWASAQGSGVVHIIDESDEIDFFNISSLKQSHLVPPFQTAPEDVPSVNDRNWFPLTYDIACDPKNRKVFFAGGHDKPGGTIQTPGGVTSEFIGVIQHYYSIDYSVGDPTEITDGSFYVLGSASLKAELEEGAFRSDGPAHRLNVGRKSAEAGSLKELIYYEGVGPFGADVTFGGIPQLQDSGNPRNAMHSESDGGGRAYLYSDRLALYAPMLNEYFYPAVSGENPRAFDLASYRILG